MKNFSFENFLPTKTFKYGFTVVLVIAANIFLNMFFIQSNFSNAEPQKAEAGKIKAAVTQNNFLYNPDIVADIVEELAPSIVNIYTQSEEKLTYSPEDFSFENRIFEHFFGIQPFDTERRVPIVKKSAGTGSGTIISSDGYILTNFHVIKNATKIMVRTNDEKEYVAKLVGSDRYSDLAVIKIDAKDLKPAKLSDSSKIRPGQWAIAIGSPKGLENTVTLGIVSAVSRKVSNLSNMNFIQTDAAINPGNSGGPLLNIKGEVIGINTAIMGSAQNIGFAIPINSAKNIVDDLKAGKDIEHPWVGMVMGPLTKEISVALGLPSNLEGVVITKVFPNSPAMLAGLMPGDVIQKINGKNFKKPEEIQSEVKTQKVNSELTMQILRNGEILVKKVKIGKWQGR